jgi:DNA-binding transcriptional LysR family regulator
LWQNLLKYCSPLQAAFGRTRPFYVLYPQNRHLTARVRVLVDYLMLNQAAGQ